LTLEQVPAAKYSHLIRSHETPRCLQGQHGVPLSQRFPMLFWKHSVHSDYFIVETDADPLPDRVLTPRPDWNNADDSAICASVMDVLCDLDARPMSTATELDAWLDSVIAILRSAEDHVPHLDRGQQPVTLMSSNTRAVFRRSKWLARQLKSPLHPSWKNT
jgi:hypothetical protein